MASEISLIYDVAVKEVGYLEKATNAYLDDKTKNAGYNNYTKYWRDLCKKGMLSGLGNGFGPNSGFAGGYNWPYCAAGVSWAMTEALGKERAMELLLHSTTMCFINCDTLATRSREKGQLVSTPIAGDIALFYNGSNYYHTEFVWEVSNGYFRTIGWNTSGASSIIANGGGVCSKVYKLSNTNVKFHRPKYNSTATIPPNAENDISVTYLKLGSNGSTVKTLQEKLIAIGFDCGSSGADGDFGNDTYNAVVKFQESYNLEVDGIVGEETTKKLNEVYVAKKNNNGNSAPGETDPCGRKILFSGECNGDCVNVRVWAGIDYGNINSIPQLYIGDKVVVLDYTQKDANGDDWYFCRMGHETSDGTTEFIYGFVYAEYISKL